MVKNRIDDYVTNLIFLFPFSILISNTNIVRIIELVYCSIIKKQKIKPLIIQKNKININQKNTQIMSNNNTQIISNLKTNYINYMVENQFEKMINDVLNIRSKNEFINSEEFNKFYNIKNILLNK